MKSNLMCIGFHEYLSENYNAQYSALRNLIWFSLYIKKILKVCVYLIT